MNTGIRTMMVVMRKELRDFFRDRRTMLMTLLLTPLLYPAMLLGMGKLAESRATTQLEAPMTIPVAGAAQAPTLVSLLASQGIRIRHASEQEVEAAVRNQKDDVGLIIDPGFGKAWQAGKPAKVEIVTDSTRRNADVPAKRVQASLEKYSQALGALRMLSRGINPAVGMPVGVGTRDMATPEAKRGMLMSVMLPILLLISAFLGGIHLAMDTTAGERERQSLEPLLATPASRGALVSGKMLAATVIGVITLLLILLAFKASAQLSSGLARSMDVSLPAISKLLLILLPLVVIGTGVVTFVAAGAKSMKEAQSHVMWMMLLPMVPSYALMAYPLKDTQLWQYAVPFLSQNQLVQKVTRGESPDPQQWGVYLASAVGLAALLWLAAVWRYRQEKLAISG
ncbi:sodium ABC transporter permease [Lysobacter oculi]|uniref:Sodium ABC transporter permease n=1 Tax=Solilutibacter oculi TaxID=2698682 RepID=A0A344J7L1_9GAMM|nr:ABC transporter permease [Lysobacter oculi]AXA85021.1 sodium ABC transporter permease [Lysobacter oculi]